MTSTFRPRHTIIGTRHIIIGTVTDQFRIKIGVIVYFCKKNTHSVLLITLPPLVTRQNVSHFLLRVLLILSFSLSGTRKRKPVKKAEIKERWRHPLRTRGSKPLWHA
jgi:hypothetical protein